MATPITTKSVDVAMRGKLDELESRLQAQLGGRVRNLKLSLKVGGVVLRGFAHTYYAKQLAQHAVMGEVDLPIVANEIVVS